MNNPLQTTHSASRSLSRRLPWLSTTLLAFAIATPLLVQGDDDDDKDRKDGASRRGGRHATHIVPPDAQAFGTTYSKLAVAWWDWAVNQPPDMNPVTDATGEFAHVGQDEDFGQGKKIFFLAGNFGGPEQTVRHCTIPRGKALFFPIVNSLWISPEECVSQECRGIANGEIDSVISLECIIDGVPVSDIFSYRAQSPPGGSPFHIRAGGFLHSLAPDFYVARGYLPGTIADGYWLLVDLDDRKEHVIEFNASRGDPAAPFQLSVKYVLTFAKDKDKGKDKDDRK